MARRNPDQVTVGTVSITPMREKGTRPGDRRYWRARTPRPERRTIWSDWATKDEAVLVVAALVAKGIPSPPPVPGGVRTVGDLLDRWATVQGERLKAGEIAPLSLDTYRRHAGHLKGELGEILVGALTRERVEDTLRTWRASDVMSPRSAKTAADVMAAVVRWGAPRGLCPALSLGGLASAAVDDEEHEYNARTPTRAEVEAILRAVPKGRARALVELLSITGARVGEVGAMTVGSYDRERLELAISGRDRRRARRGKVATRFWPVHGRLGALLEELVADRPADAPLIADLPHTIASYAYRTVTDACTAAGVEPVTPHGLRRLVAMELLEESGNAKAVSRLTGHSVAILLKHYVRPTDESLRDLVKRVARRKSKGKVLRMVGAPERGTNAGELDGDDT